MGDTPFPVQMIGFPTSPGKHKDCWPLVTFVEGRFVYEAEFLLTRHHPKERSRGEDRKKIHEVLATEVRFTLGGERQDATVAPDDLGIEHRQDQGRHPRRVHL